MPPDSNLSKNGTARQTARARGKKQSDGATTAIVGQWPSPLWLRSEMRDLPCALNQPPYGQLVLTAT